jgi:hypothetical protein
MICQALRSCSKRHTYWGEVLTPYGPVLPSRWAGEDVPWVQFRSLTCRPKNRNGNQQRACVGDWGAGLKGWDFGKHTWRGIFDGDIPYQLEAQEQLLDWTFDRLSITGELWQSITCCTAFGHHQQYHLIVCVWGVTVVVPAGITIFSI